jgi:hypothetical protein
MRGFRIQRIILAAMTLALLPAASATPTFRIESIFSNLDGSAQFVQLVETAGLDGQHRFAGLALTVTRDGVTREYVFANDLPSEATAHATVLVAAGSLPIQAAWNSTCCAVADYTMPARFLPTDGAAVDFAGVDRQTYARLPTDGINALRRDGTEGLAVLPASACPDEFWFQCRMHEPIHVAETIVRAVEYHHAALGHHFLTASAPDLDALDSQRIPGWQRTGATLAVGARPWMSINWNVWDYPPPSPFPMQPVCRFYLPPASGDSHFYSVSASECEDVRVRYPHFVLERSAAFYAVQPNVLTGECQQGVGFELAQVYRLWNARLDTNHRYTLEPAVRDAMVARGDVSEGYGPAGVAFCVPLGI